MGSRSLKSTINKSIHGGKIHCIATNFLYLNTDTPLDYRMYDAKVMGF